MADSEESGQSKFHNYIGQMKVHDEVRIKPINKYSRRMSCKELAKKEQRALKNH